MDIRFILVVLALSLIIATMMYFLQQKTGVTRKALYIIFSSLFVIALVGYIVSYMIGGWTGLGIGVWSIYIGAPSLTTLLVLKLTDN